MRIAIANDGGYVSSHFGQCAEYRIFDVQEGSVASETSIPTPPHEPCALPGYLAQFGIDTVITGGMGMRAQQNFALHRIEVILGVQGRVEDILEAYLRGTLVGGESSCSHSGHGCHAE